MRQLNIYVVQPGDSLYRIANRFGVSADEIFDINRLEEMPYLVVGQALVIPTTETAYRVQPGDSLYTIARRFNADINRIIELNNIQNPQLIQPGTVLRIPQRTRNYGFIEVNAFLEPSTPKGIPRW